MRRGFTLVEVVITVALFAIVSLAITLLCINFYSAYASEQGQITASKSAATAMRELFSLTAVADAVATNHVFANTTYNSSTTTLVLEIPSVDSSGIVVSGSYDYAVFYLTGTTLYRALAASAASARVSGSTTLSSSVSAFAITYSSSDYTEVATTTADISTSVTARGKTFSAHLKENLHLRNHSL